MLARSWIAVLLLVNYLLVAGMGCMSRPDDQREFVLIQTGVGGHYQECRYLRMDGLEDFLVESLAARYHSNSETTPHHLISVVHGVDAHCLPGLSWLLPAPVVCVMIAPPTDYWSAVSGGIRQIVYSPPRLS